MDNFDGLVGRNMRALRRAAGLSQVDLAAALAERGFTLGENAIVKIERGTRPIRLEEAIAVAAQLGIPVDVLADPQTVERVATTTTVTAARATTWNVDTVELEQRIARLQAQVEQLTALVEQPALI